jgi:hypothetical protein
MLRSSALLSCLLLTLCAPFGMSQVAVTTHHNDTSRTGQNLTETTLTTSNVNVNTFGKLFSRTVSGQIYAQPLYVPNLSVGGVTRNVVFVATQNDNIYAFDADDPAASVPLWQTNLGTPGPSTDVGSACADITPVVGITSTPVIDPSTNTIYVVAKTKNIDNSYHFKIHALDLFTGLDKLPPTEITAQVPGTGVQSVGGIVSLDPLQQFQRPGLLLLNGVVYVAFGSACETPPWHGWVLGYSASTLQQVAVLNTTPNGSDGGIWGGGQGLLADSAGNIYAMTGNGTFDPTIGGDYGDSVLKISTSPTLAIVDYFTPKNQAALDSVDLDLGSGGPMALPGTNPTLIVGAGKDGVVRLLNTTNLGQFHSTSDNDVQEFQGVVINAANAVFMGAPIFWNSPNHGPMIYMWSGNDFLKAYKFSNGKFVTTPALEGTVQEALGYSNSVPLSLSANGSQAGTGIIWAPAALTFDANLQTVTGILRAFDATSLTLLWDSTQNASRDTVGSYAKFSPATVANGKVYLATFSNQLLVYGLLPNFSLSGSPGSATVFPGQSASFSVTVQPQNNFTGTVTLACSGLPAGATCSFNPASLTPSGGAATSTLTISTLATTPAGTATVTINSTAGSLVHSTTVALAVIDFSIAGSPGSATVVPGQTATYTVTVQPQNNFTGTVMLACSGLPAGASCSFNPASVTPSGGAATSTLTISTLTTTPFGNSTVTINSTAGSLVHSTTVALAVADFTIAGKPASATVTAGQPAIYALTLQSLGSFNGTVALACSGLPAKATCSFNPASVALTGASGSSTLTISTIAPSLSANVRPASYGMSSRYAVLLPLSGLVMMGLGLAGSRKRRVPKFFLCLMLLTLVLVQARCGGSMSTTAPPQIPGTPAGTFPITVTATSSVVHSTNVTLVVK